KLEKQTTFVGAGDCFNGAFLHMIFDSVSIRDSLEFAVKCASHLIETGIYPTL
ncbi:MAG: PfkB family carbohydrate kinase, partial [Candidatus Heimdallarchaeaceae archaeon]